MTTDLVPLEQKYLRDAALRRGPAEIIKQDAQHVVLLGKPSEALGVRLKKEFRLDGAAPRVFFIVTALSNGGGPGGTSLRNAVRLPAKSTVRIPSDGTFGPLQDKAKAPWAIVNSKEFWLVPVPPTARTEALVLGGFAPGGAGGERVGGVDAAAELCRPWIRCGCGMRRRCCVCSTTPRAATG